MDKDKYINKSIYEYIEEKYGTFNEETFKKFICSDFSNQEKVISNMDDENFYKIKRQIDNLLSFQNLTYEDIQYLGEGQTFSTLGIGNSVIKVGRIHPKYSKTLEIPYRLNPVYQENLKGNIGLYISQKGVPMNITEKDLQDMYNLIRENNGLWLDIKESNLACIDHKMDFSTLYPDSPNYKLKHKFPKYDKNLFIIDYEDIVFLTPDLKETMLENNGYIPGCNVHNLNPELLLSEENPDKIFYEQFIKHDPKLLKYEINYQKSKGNTELAEQYNNKLNEFYNYGIKSNKSYTGKEIGEYATKKTCLSKLKKLIHTIKNKFFKRSDNEKTNNEQSRTS